MILLILLVFVILLLNIYSKKKISKESFRNKYDFIAIVKDWKNIYEKYKYNNKSLHELNNKYNTYKMCRDLHIPTPELYHYGNFDDITDYMYNKKAFVIKPQIGHSSTNVFPLINIDNKLFNQFNGTEVTKQKLNNTFKNKKVIVEEFIRNDDGKYTIPDDYKIYCFKGNIGFILHKYYKYGKYYVCYYTKDWKPIDIETNNKFYKGEAQPRPKHLFKMVNMCRFIANKVFPNVFVRLDFYLNNTYPVFGEVTPSPNSGRGFTDIKTRNWLNYLCQKYNLYYEDEYDQKLMIKH